MRNYDLEFLKRFSMVIALLMAITLGLILFAAYLHTRIPPEVSPQAAKRTELRIAPAGAVYAGATGADIAHLCTAVFRIEIGLELQCVPVIGARFQARHA